MVSGDEGQPRCCSRELQNVNKNKMTRLPMSARYAETGRYLSWILVLTLSVVSKDEGPAAALCLGSWL